MSRFAVLLTLVALTTTTLGFHLQSDPSIVNRVCSQQIRQICNYVGMQCRGNQRFDADTPHAVCDYPGRRTQGYSPRQVYQYIMSRRGGGQGW